MRKPTDEIAGCCWLPRFIDKVRMWDSGELSFIYRMAFCSQFGVDGYFLRHFQLSRKELLKTIRASDGCDDLVHLWFLAQPTVTSKRIAEWKDFASGLGGKGNPGYWIFHVLKWILYPKAVVNPVSTMFEAIIQDEE